MKLADCASWHYQLQGVPAKTVAEDLIVCDIDVEGGPKPHLKKPNGQDRQVLAYLSIGEAEDYRKYWPSLKGTGVVIGENPEWKGNFAVRFWRLEWVATILGRAREARALGFTGLYLDKCDVYEDILAKWTDIAEEVPDIEAAMAVLVNMICTEVPELSVVMQNAVDLLAHRNVAAVIEGVGVEDLQYGERETGKKNLEESTRDKTLRLRSSGLPVFCVEYLGQDGKAMETCRVALRGNGWPLTIETKDRALDGRPVMKYGKG